MTSIQAGVTQGHSCTDSGRQCRGCPKGSMLLHARTRHSTGMGSGIVRVIAPTGDVDGACPVLRRASAATAAVLGAGWLGVGSRREQMEQHGGDRGDRKPGAAGAAGPTAGARVLQRGTWKCRGVRGGRGCWGPSEHGARVPRPRVCSRDRLTLLPAPPPAPVPLVSAMSSWRSARPPGRTPLVPMGSAMPAAPKGIPAGITAVPARHRPASTALPGAGTRDSGSPFLELQ